MNERPLTSTLTFAPIVCALLASNCANSAPPAETSGDSTPDAAGTATVDGGFANVPDSGTGASSDGGTGNPSDSGDLGAPEGGTPGATDSGATAAADSGHVVRPCMPGNGVTGAVGVWENITPPTVSLDPNLNTPAGQNYGVANFAVDPQDTSVVYLGTSAQGIYQSKDCGATWTHVNTGTNGMQLDQGRNWTMVIDPSNPQVIYTCAGYGPGGVFKSTNAGVDWEQMLTQDVIQYTPYGGFVQAITMDPTNPQHLLVSYHGGCTGPFGSGCLTETMDGGQHWTLLQSAEPWSEGDGQMMIDSKLWLMGSLFGGVWRTTDGAKTWTKVFSGNASNGPLYQSHGTLYLPGLSGVLQSQDGITWQTIPNSPKSVALVGDGTTIFTSSGLDYVPAGSTTFYSSAPEAAPTTWTTLQTPVMTQGGRYMAYDPDHNILYSANTNGGFWRVVTK